MVIPHVRQKARDMGHTLRSEDAAGKAQLDCLYHRGRRALFGFADQKVNMIRHDHISDNHEPITLTHLLQHLKKEIATLCASQKRSSSITTPGDEMQIVVSVKPFQMGGRETI